MIKLLIIKIICITVMIVLTIICLDRLTNIYLSDNSYYRLEKSPSVLILGNSFTECALNDRLIGSSINYSQSADTYYYIYYKAIKLIEANSSVNKLMLGCSDGQFSERMTEWIYRDEYLSEKYPKLSHLIGIKEKLFLLAHNPLKFMEISCSAFVNKADFLFYKNLNIPAKLKWGGYLYLVRDDIPRSIFNLKENASPMIPDRKATTNINTQYLLKIAAYCKNHNIELILIRTPLHKFCSRPLEKELKNLLANELAGVEFWDYVDYPLQDDEFGDFSHLNLRGARIFSSAIEKRLRMMNASRCKNRLGTDFTGHVARNELRM
jgi:hypothetical protein